MADPAKFTEEQTQRVHYGLFVKGKMNGVREFQSSKNGKVYRSLLVSVPGQSSALQIDIPPGFDVTRYPIFSDVTFSIVQTEFNGKINGYRLAQS